MDKNNSVDAEQASQGPLVETAAEAPDLQSCVAGRELDALVDERVMGIAWPENLCRVCGWKLAKTIENGCVSDNCSMRPTPSRRADEPPHYSTSIVAAMQVVEKMRAEDFMVTIMDLESGKWEVSFDLWSGGPEGEDVSLPVAICRAALAAIPHKLPERDAETTT